MMCGWDIHYDLADGHPLLGRRMPDLDVLTPAGTVRVFTFLHDARAVLLNLAEPSGFDITPWAHRVVAIDAEYAGTPELPVLGQISAPAAVLIRPDGHGAWVGDGTDTGLRHALTTWSAPHDLRRPGTTRLPRRRRRHGRITHRPTARRCKTPNSR
jgi:3-(3-hydroxy-phenyl)propionate hydroxylase